MKRNLSMIFTAVIATVLLILVPTNGADVSANAQSVQFEIKEAGSNNTSIADGYFNKPAKYTVENGKHYVELTLDDPDGYLQSISGPYGGAQVSGSTLKLQIGDPNQPIPLSMHVVVPEDIIPDYDHHHKARLVLSGISSSSGSTDNSATAAAGAVENPPTGDSTPIATYVALIVAAVGVFVVYRLRVARTE